MHFLEVTESKVIALLELACPTCVHFGEETKCKIFHKHNNGTFKLDHRLISALYCCKFRFSWNIVYNTLISFLGLKNLNVKEDWSYSKYKQYMRNIFRSCQRWLDNRHFWRGDAQCATCHSRGCQLELCTPDDCDLEVCASDACPVACPDL